MIFSQVLHDLSNYLPVNKTNRLLEYLYTTIVKLLFKEQYNIWYHEWWHYTPMVFHDTYDLVHVLESCRLQMSANIFQAINKISRYPCYNIMFILTLGYVLFSVLSDIKPYW